MSLFSKQVKNKTINIKNLLFQTYDDFSFKYKNLKLSSLNQLFHTTDGDLTDRSEKHPKKSSRINHHEISKTMRDSNKKIFSKKIFNPNNKSIKRGNNLIKTKKEENNSLNKMMNTHREINKIKNLILEYSDIKPKKQKFIQINNDKNIKKVNLINKFFFKSNHCLIKNLSRNSNNNNSFKTNISNTFHDLDINNYTQRNTYIENQKLIPLFTRRINAKPLNISKNKNNNYSKNLVELLLNNSSRNNILNSKFKENLNIFKTYNYDNKSNRNNSKNIKSGKKKKIQLLMKQNKKSLNKTLPYRDKLLKDIKLKYILNNKIKTNKQKIKKIDLVKKSIKLINNNINSTNKQNNNTITISSKPKINIIKKTKEKNIQKNIYKKERIIKNKSQNKEMPKNNINTKYTKKIIFSPTPPKTKENTITVKDPILKKVSKIDSCTLAGYNISKEQKINQDNFFIKKNFLDEKEQFFLGVCDGHGESGHLISSYISKCLPNFLADSSDKNIISTYKALNQNLVENSKIDCSLSGSTCSSIILTQEKIISINLGDSRTILGKKENNKYYAINLSTDHKPELIEEKKRILLNGGRIKPYYDETTKKFLGPDRVWIREEDIPGLAMTRSFGDTIAHSVGVISEPEIKKYEFSGNEKFIIIASDGIWEYITSEECVDIIKDFYENNMDAVGAIHFIMEEAFNRWKKYDEIIDDITIIIVFFE